MYAQRYKSGQPITLPNNLAFTTGYGNNDITDNGAGDRDPSDALGMAGNAVSRQMLNKQIGNMLGGALGKANAPDIGQQFLDKTDSTYGLFTPETIGGTQFTTADKWMPDFSGAEGADMLSGLGPGMKAGSAIFDMATGGDPLKGVGNLALAAMLYSNPATAPLAFMGSLGLDFLDF